MFKLNYKEVIRLNRLQKIDNITKHLDKTLIFLSLSLLCISAGAAVISVFLRYFFDVSLQIIEEICRFTIIYGAFLYLGPLIKTNEHLKMSILADYMKGRIKHLNDLFISIVLFAAFIFLLYSAIVWVNSLLSMNIKTVSGSMLLFVPTLSIPIGMLLGCIYSLQQIIRDFYLFRHFKEVDLTAYPEEKTQNQVL